MKHNFHCLDDGKISIMRRSIAGTTSQETCVFNIYRYKRYEIQAHQQLLQAQQINFNLNYSMLSPWSRTVWLEQWQVVLLIDSSPQRFPTIDRFPRRATMKSHSFSMAKTTRAMPSILALFFTLLALASFFSSSSMAVIFCSTSLRKWSNIFWYAVLVRPSITPIPAL